MLTGVVSHDIVSGSSMLIGRVLATVDGPLNAYRAMRLPGGWSRTTAELRDDGWVYASIHGPQPREGNALIRIRIRCPAPEDRELIQLRIRNVAALLSRTFSQLISEADSERSLEGNIIDLDATILQRPQNWPEDELVEVDLANAIRAALVDAAILPAEPRFVAVGIREPDVTWGMFRVEDWSLCCFCKEGTKIAEDEAIRRITTLASGCTTR